MLRIGPKWASLSALTFILCFGLPEHARGCPYSIRDVGFSSWNRGTYRLYLFLKDNLPESDRVASLFETQSAAALADSNVEAEVIRSDKRQNHDATEHLLSLGVNRFPAAILVSPDDRAIARPGMEKGFASAKMMRSELQKIVSSPAIEELKDYAVTNWCVVALVPGRNEEETVEARAEIESASDEIIGLTTDMGGIIESGPHLIVARAEDPAERIFLWSIGIERESQQPRAVVLYGRGTQMGPILEGDAITRKSLLIEFQALGRNCSCVTDPALWAGPSIPLCWGDVLQAEARETLGFDPDAPGFRSAVAEYVPGAGASSFMQGVIGYSEGYIEYVDKPPKGPTAAQAAVKPIPAKPEKTSVLERRAGYAMILALAGMISLVALASGVLIARRMRTS